MKKFILLSMFYLLKFSMYATAQEDHLNQGGDITGFWKTVDEKTLKPQSIIAIYPYQGHYFGRIILTYYEDGSVQDTIYNPKKRALGVVGNPYYVGLDIIWGLKNEGSKYKDGTILDPEKGHVYGAEAWRQDDKLIVRGKLLIFGRNQTWPPATEIDFPDGFQKPDLSLLIPVIPKTAVHR